MATERVDYYSDEEFQQALRQEEEYYQSQNQQQQEPDVVPCFNCGYQMYQTSLEPKENLCAGCLEEIGEGLDELNLKEMIKSRGKEWIMERLNN